MTTRTLTLDHLAVAADTLEAGVAHVEACLGVSPAPGGQHAAMGTHNRLLGLGPGLYLEVIAINPEAPRPDRARWFDLDRFSGAPRLSNWVLRGDDLREAIDRTPAGVGTPLALARADLRWQMAVPDDGRLPFDGVFPALMAWEGNAHPSQRLPESHCRLTALELFHPDAERLAQSLDAVFSDPRVTVRRAAQPALRARFATAHGERVLT